MQSLLNKKATSQTEDLRSDIQIGLEEVRLKEIRCENEEQGRKREGHGKMEDWCRRKKKQTKPEKSSRGRLGRQAGVRITP